MTQKHPITPPPELVEQWRNEWHHAHGEFGVYIATQAARWGADQELEACKVYLAGTPYPSWAIDLHSARRPKPPSLKELNLKHLEVMERDGHYLPEIISDLRHAIESLPS